MSEHILSKYSNKFVSRWLILVVDMMIVSLSFIAAYVLRHNFHISNISWQSVERQFLFMLYVRLGCFFYFRSYTGIIRHTSIEDAILLFKTITLSTFVAGFFSLVIRYISGYDTPYYVPLSILSIDYFICLFLLVSSRFLVKAVYESLILEFKSAKSVLIYGAGYSGLITKNVLLNDKVRGYHILGFIDDNPAKVNKTIEGIRVYNRDDAVVKFLDNLDDSQEVIVAIKKISPSAKREISDYFLEKGIVVKTLPPVEKWVNGEFSVNQIHNVKIEDLLERDSIEMNNTLISKEVDGKVVMVTGAAGSIGSEIVRQLLNYYPTKIVAIASSRNIPDDKTVVCLTRYGNVMASRGSVIPLFINQIKDGKAITITDPNMTRFLMSLDEAVDLVLFAFQFGKQGDLFVQKAPACTINTLAEAVLKTLGVKTEIKIIGTRHGEKLYETLCTREEMVKAEDLGVFFRIPADNRDLNYGKYFSDGEPKTSEFDDYNSHNTRQLNVEETQEALLKLSYIQNVIKNN